MTGHDLLLEALKRNGEDTGLGLALGEAVACLCEAACFDIAQDPSAISQICKMTTFARAIVSITAIAIEKDEPIYKGR